MNKSDQLQLNGVDVYASWLTQRAFRAVPCDFMLRVTPQNRKAMLAELTRVGTFGPYRGLQVVGIADLGFLSDFPDLLYLELIDQDKVDTAPLANLQNLRGLRIQTPGKGIDFAWFPLLEVFVGDWHAGNCNLQCCRELHQIRAWGFKPKSGDLTELANIPRLEWLELTQTNVQTLAGIETLADLRYCSIAYAPQLRSLAASASGDLQLRDLELSKAKKIESYEPLAALRWLRRLKISSCAPLPNLQWTRGLNLLDSFSFVDTNVDDGDLTPLQDLPELRYVGSFSKKNYNLNVDKLNEQFQQRHGPAE